MKDKVTRTNQKRPSHRLFRAMILTVSLTCVFSVAALSILFNVSLDNKTLNKKIENYTVQIDMLEKSDSETYLKKTND